MVVLQSLTTQEFGSCIGALSSTLTPINANDYHSHIDWHLEACLAIVFGESPEDNVSGPQSQITPQAWKDLCPAYDELEPEFQ